MFKDLIRYNLEEELIPVCVQETTSTTRTAKLSPNLLLEKYVKKRGGRGLKTCINPSELTIEGDDLMGTYTTTI